MSTRTLLSVAALFICVALGAQESSRDIGLQDVGGIPEVAASGLGSYLYSGPASASTARIVSAAGPRLGMTSSPVASGPLVPANRVSSFGFLTGIWSPAGISLMGTESTASMLIDLNLEGLRHMPGLGNALAVGYTIDWTGNLDSDLSFMTIGLGASSRYYVSPFLPVWVGARLVPTYYILANGPESIRLLGYADVGVSYALGNMGLDIRGSLFLTGSTRTVDGDTTSLVGYGLTVGYSALKGK